MSTAAHLRWWHIATKTLNFSKKQAECSGGSQAGFFDISVADLFELYFSKQKEMRESNTPLRLSSSILFPGVLALNQMTSREVM